jgi:NAD(P)-dependent dehydrogenase (short-subunit alcohol dehydrogenase family)
MHAARIGASRGIGRATAPLLLEDPNRSVSLLLRIPCTIESDPDFQKHIEQGRVTIVEGDAEDQEVLRRLLEPKGIDSIVVTLGMMSLLL